jgi:hypothetical protein
MVLQRPTPEGYLEYLGTVAAKIVSCVSPDNAGLPAAVARGQRASELTGWVARVTARYAATGSSSLFRIEIGVFTYSVTPPRT